MLIIGKKHYPRTLQNIETRQQQLVNIHKELGKAYSSKEARKMLRTLDKAIVKYDIALIRIYRAIAVNYKRYLIENGRYADIVRLNLVSLDVPSGSILQDISWHPE